MAVSTILDDDAPVPVTITDGTVTEGDAGTVAATFTVTLSAPSALPVTIGFATADITANSIRDYLTTSGALTLAPGRTVATIAVPVVGDRVDEAIETFAVNLTAVAHVVVADGQGIGQINENDPLPVVSVDPTVATEGNAAVFTVRLSAPSDQVVQVGFTTSDGTATAAEVRAAISLAGPSRLANGGIDFLPLTGTLVFRPGETVASLSIPIPTDLEDKPTETFFLNLSGPINATRGAARAQARILDVTGPSLVDLQRLGFHRQPTSIVLTVSTARCSS